MKLPDSNIWLALAISSHAFHSVAAHWFASQSAPRSVILCRATQQSFLRLVTTEKFMRLYHLPPLTNAAAWQVMDAFLQDPRITYASEPENTDSIWKTLATRQTASPKLWMDAYLAAFAIAGKYQLLTTDKAFTQFQKLNPTILSKQ